MKILFWGDGFWPRVGGIETQALQFIEAMMKRGHQFLVIAHKDDPDWKDEEVHRGITIKRFDFDTIIPRQELKRLRPIDEFLKTVVKEFQPDLIQLNACVGWSAFIFLLFKAMFPIPLVLTVHSPFFYENENNPLIQRLSRHCSRICCVSHWAYTATEKLIPEAKDKLQMIYNGLAMPPVTPSALSFSPPTLLILGRLTKEKGFDTAIRAFSLLKEEARFILAGGGDELDSLKKLAEELRVPVQFTGKLPREQIPSLINQASIVIVPSYFESFGLVVVEAMQMGRPVIVSEVGGMKEIVANHKTGLFVPPKDPNALSQAIERLLKAPEKAKEMGLNGRKRSLERFTIEQNANEYEALYQELL